MSLINSLNVADATQALCERPDRLLSPHHASDAEDATQARASVAGSVVPGWKMGIHSPPSARRHPAASTVFGTPVASSSCAGDRVRSAMEAVSSMARFSVSKQAAVTSPPRTQLPPDPPLEVDDVADVNLSISHRALSDGKPRRRGSSKRGAVRGGLGRGSFPDAGVGRARMGSSGSDGAHAQMSSPKFLYAIAPNALVSVSAVPRTCQQGQQANQVATPVHVQSVDPRVSGTVASHNQASAMPASNALRNIVMRQDANLQSKAANCVNQGVKEPLAAPLSAGPKFQSPASVTNHIVKNRFIHSRPVTALKICEKVPASNTVSSLRTSINGALVVSTAWSQSNSSMVPTCLLGVSAVPAGIMKVAVPFASPVKTISAGATTSAEGLVRQLGAPISASVSLAMPQCPICRFSEISVIAPNCFKCMRPECSQQFYGGIQGLQQRRGIHASSGNATALFYGVQHHQVVSSSPSLAMLNHITCALASSNLPPPPMPSGSNRKRSSCGTPTKGLFRRKNQPAECIDLVSSDEEEGGKKRSCPDPGHRTSDQSAVNSTDLSDQSVTLASTPRLTDRMKLQDGTRPASEPIPSPRPPTPVTPSTAVAPSNSAGSGPQVDALYWFNCGRAMFGELYGKALAPVRVTESRIFLSLECQILRNGVHSSEKYTLSVGKIDIGAVKVYFGRCPSLVAISTAPRFSEVACKRIGKDVLNPTSPDPRKRHIILSLSHAFQSDVEAAKEMSLFVAAVSPWAPVEILTLQHAIAIVQEAQLCVSQMEISLSPPESVTPVQTLFVYPPPPKPGGIPITTDDLACLADGVYLNDVIIDFYLKYTFDRILTLEQREKTYIFNSYFYKRMTQRQGTKFSAESMHAQVKKWTRSVDIFSKDFIVIPVNEHSHWYLVIVCFPGSALLNDKGVDEKDEEEEDMEEESGDFVKEEGPLEDAPAHKSSVLAEAASAENGVSEMIRAVSQSTDSVVPPVSLDSERGHIDLHSTVRSSESPVTHDAVEEVAYARLQLMEIASAGVEDRSERHTKMVGDDDTAVIRNELNETGKIFVKSEQAGLDSSEKSQHVQATDMDVFHRPCILIFDSLVGSGHSRVFSNLRNYLTQEWSCRKPGEPSRVFDKSNMKGCYPKIPRQNNDCDCGVFLLEYAEAFFVKPVKCYRMPMFLDNWFSLETVAGKRGRLTDLIKKLTEELCVEKT